MVCPKVVSRATRWVSAGPTIVAQPLPGNKDLASTWLRLTARERLVNTQPNLGLSCRGLYGCEMTESAFSKDYSRFCHLLAEARRSRHLTQAAVAARLGKPQSYVSKYERGERRLDVVEFIDVAGALDVDPLSLVKELLVSSRSESGRARPMPLSPLCAGVLSGGLSEDMISDALERVYEVLAMIDDRLMEQVDLRLSEIVELANLSSMLGNIFASSIVNLSGGVFERAGPHKYQDLRATAPDSENIEVKVALERNRPKGHLAKEGHYLVLRYVLGDGEGRFTRGTRGDVVWIWEVRFGELEEDDFSLSDTPGDSGKTAVVTTDGMKKLRRVYFEERFCPYADTERYLRVYG